MAFMDAVQFITVSGQNFAQGAFIAVNGVAIDTAYVKATTLSGVFTPAAIGAAIVFALREYLSTLVPWWQYVLGAVYVLTILYLPSGLMGIPERFRQRRTLLGKREELGKREDPRKLASVPS
jgi:branched-chain amino acid transport system permease protein